MGPLKVLPLSVLLIFSVGSIQSGVSEGSKQTLCGGWEPFKDEKCFMLLEDKGLKDFESAAQACAESEATATIATITSPQEQQFVSDYLYNTHAMVDGVWISARRGPGNGYTWPDGSKVRYTNWLGGSPRDSPGLDCVELKGVYGMAGTSHAGKWADASCRKRNLIFCQKMQTWSVSRIQETLLATRRELSEKLEAKIVEVNVQVLEPKLLPIGFIYTQLSAQPEPKILWPSMEWQDISSEYAGLFFRVLGGGSASLGQVQEEASPRLSGVESMTGKDVMTSASQLTAGTWSPKVYTGSNSGATEYSLRFQVSSAEVRPKNKAMKIWRRIR